MSTSHDWARELQKTAEFLLSRPEIQMPAEGIPSCRVRYWGEGGKPDFLKFVRATVPGKKVIYDSSVEFQANGAHLEMAIDRSVVCRKVQDVKYECEPLLSPEEETELQVSDIPV